MYVFRLGFEVVVLQVCGSGGGRGLHRDGAECQHHQQDPEVVQQREEDDVRGSLGRLVQGRHLPLAGQRHHQKQQAGQWTKTDAPKPTLY